MRIINYFLYTTTFLALCWSVVFIAAPSAIKMGFKYYFADAVKPHQISVSPRFDISVGRLEFALEDIIDLPKVYGVSRAVRLNWSILDSNPFISITLGPTTIEDYGYAENIQIQTLAFKDFDLRESKVFLEAEKFTYDSVGKVDYLELDGIVAGSFTKLTDMSFRLKSFTSLTPENISIESVAGSLSKIDFVESIDAQSIALKFKADNVFLNKETLNMTQVDGEFTSMAGQLNYNINFNNSDYPKFGGFPEALSVNGNSLAFDAFDGKSVKLEDVQLVSQYFNIYNMTLNLSRPGDGKKYVVFLGGNLEVPEIVSQKGFVAKMPPSSFSANISFDKRNNEIIANSHLNIEKFFEPKVSATSNGRVKFNSADDIFTCVITFCVPSDFDLSYQVNFDEERITGNLLCDKDYCPILTLTHTLMTSNTNEVIKKLNASKLLNPFIVALFYASLTSGQKIGSGHKINL